jgi:hypothetical protein
MWSEISKMKALENLRVDIVLSSTYVHAYYEHVLFTPLETVQGLKEFEVYANWTEDEELQQKSRGKVWPFKIRRGMGMML